MSSIWTRRSLKVFFLVSFGLPWIGWTINAFGHTEPPLRTILFYLGDFMAVGGLVATWVAGGGVALRGLLRRLVRGGGAVWWLYALLLPLAWSLGARVVYGLAHGTMTALDVSGLAAFVSTPALLAWTTGPIGEEAGWRGYLLPRLLTRHSPLVATLVLGLLWDVWHVPLYVHSVFSSGTGAFHFTVGVLCYTAMMTVLFFRTRGSVLLAMIFHWSVNVAPGVADRMLPVAPHAGAGGVLSGYQTGASVVAALAVMALAGWRTLGARADFEPARDLADEFIAADRLAT